MYLKPKNQDTGVPLLSFPFNPDLLLFSPNVVIFNIAFELRNEELRRKSPCKTKEYFLEKKEEEEETNRGN